MAFKTLDDMELGGKVVMARVDINVPVDGGHVTDTTRIDRIKPTVDHLRSAGAKTVLLAHFGRPKGQIV
ncbi:MAG: phosphoglycerate kinase, partial [Pseudomonadota bacterium]